MNHTHYICNVFHLPACGIARKGQMQWNLIFKELMCSPKLPLYETYPRIKNEATVPPYHHIFYSTVLLPFGGGDIRIPAAKRVDSCFVSKDVYVA